MYISFNKRRRLTSEGLVNLTGNTGDYESELRSAASRAKMLSTILCPQGWKLTGQPRKTIRPNLSWTAHLIARTSDNTTGLWASGEWARGHLTTWLLGIFYNIFLLSHFLQRTALKLDSMPLTNWKYIKTLRYLGVLFLSSVPSLMPTM